MRAFLVALRKELTGQWRSRRFLIVVVILVAFGLLSPLTAKFMPELFKLMPNGADIAKLIPPPTDMDAVAQYIKNTNQFALILALLLAMGAVAEEKDKGTAALALVKPMPRWAWLLAKFVALSLTFVVGIALAGVACYYYTLLLFGPMSIPGWLALNGLLLLSTLLYVSLTLFASTLARSQAVAAGLAVGLLILLAIVGSIPRLGEYLPGQLTTWATAIMAGSSITAWPALAVTAGLIIASFVGASAALSRQEL